MKEQTFTYYLPMLLEGLVAWSRIGEILIYRNQLWDIQVGQKLPLTDESSLNQLKSILPRFENIRNFVVVKIKKPEFARENDFSTYITYDDVIGIYSLDAEPASQRYLQSLLPSQKIEQQSILDNALSKNLINWSAKRNAVLGANKLLSLPNIKNDYSIIESDSWKNMLEACFLNEIPKDAEKITRFFHALFFSFSRNSITCKYNYVDLGFIDDIKNILQIAIDTDTLQGLGLSYGDTLKNLANNYGKASLSELIKKILEDKNIIQGLKEYYKDDYFIPALIFLKLKQLHEKPINYKVGIFYNLVNELNSIGCDRDLISVGVSWYGAYFGYIEIREMYYEAKEYVSMNEAPIKVVSLTKVDNKINQVEAKEIIKDFFDDSESSLLKMKNPETLQLFDDSNETTEIVLYSHDTKGNKLVAVVENRKFHIKYEDSTKDWVQYDKVKKMYQEDKKVFIKMKKQTWVTLSDVKGFE